MKRLDEKEYINMLEYFCLHRLKSKLDEILNRENRLKLAKGCFNFLEHRVNLDLLGWSDFDIFKH